MVLQSVGLLVRGRNFKRRVSSDAKEMSQQKHTSRSTSGISHSKPPIAYNISHNVHCKDGYITPIVVELVSF
jgi:hypothetical protein